MTMLPSFRAWRMRAVLMFLMRALVWKLSVTMPIWAPVKLMAGSPRAWMAMAMSAMEICSPVARSMSISRAGGCSLISRAREINSSVVSPRALTTTMTWLPACLARMARRAAAVIRSAVATLLPPNFCTIRDKAMVSLFSLNGNKEMIVLDGRACQGRHSRCLRQTHVDQEVRDVGGVRHGRRRLRLESASADIHLAFPVATGHTKISKKAGLAQNDSLLCRRGKYSGTGPPVPSHLKLYWNHLAGLLMLAQADQNRGCAVGQRNLEPVRKVQPQYTVFRT